MDPSVAHSNDESKRETEDETVSISENISLGDVSDSSDSKESGENLKFVGNIAASPILETLDESNKNDNNESDTFLDDAHLDNLISNSNIAQHFLDNDVSAQTDTFESKNSLNLSNPELDSLDAVLDEIELDKESPRKQEEVVKKSNVTKMISDISNPKMKENSPSADETIFINDNKVTLSALKTLHSDENIIHQSALTNNKNVWNDSQNQLVHSSLESSQNRSSLGSPDIPRQYRSLDSNSNTPYDYIDDKSNVEDHQSLNSEKDKSDEEVMVSKSDTIGIESTKPTESDNSDKNESVNTPTRNSIFLESKMNHNEEQQDRERKVKKMIIDEPAFSEPIITKRMVEVPEQIELLDDISEESERALAHSDNSYQELKQSIVMKDIQNASIGDSKLNDNCSIVSVLENKVKELQEIIVGKDICLTALNMQLSNSRRESLNNGRDSPKDMNGSGRESSSLITMSTEYRTIQDEYLGKMLDIQGEITERDDLIEQLTESLQQSMTVRAQLQEHSEKLSSEVMQLRDQLTNTIALIRKTPNKITQGTSPETVSDVKSPKNLADVVQQLHNILTIDEQKHFNEIENKLSQFLQREMSQFLIKAELNGIDAEKRDLEEKVKSLENELITYKENSFTVLQKQELEGRHSQEMEDLRKYFEKKCVDMEKHYSAEVFSQESRRLSNGDSNSDLSDQDNILDEQNMSYHSNSSPKRKNKTLFFSPTHRKLTPTDVEPLTKEESIILTKDDFNANLEFNYVDKNLEPTVDELKEFYNDRLKEINDIYNEKFAKMKENFKPFDHHLQGDEELTSNKNESNVIVTNEQHDFNLIVAEYDRRLNEQVALARKDVLDELEIQIQALLSDTATEDNNWPPELILLREKFTAKSQLEVAQIQIKHEEEMARMKADFEKQLQRKLKRQTTFDLGRDLDKIINERDSLRDLSSTLRSVLNEFAKYFTIYEDDLNSTAVDDLNRNSISGEDAERTLDMDVSAISNISEKRKQMKSIWDVTNLLSIIEDPSLIEYISKNKENRCSPAISEVSEQLDIQVCLEKLKSEAFSLLKLSEKFAKISSEKDDDNEKSIIKNDSCEEEDGLKRSVKKKLDFISSKSFDESVLNESRFVNGLSKGYESLPTTIGNKSEINIQLHELRNRLLKSEDERRTLEIELSEAISRNDSLVQEMSETKLDLQNYKLSSMGKEIFTEGYGTNQTKVGNCPSFIELQEKAKNMLSASVSGANMSIDNTELLHLVEEFCRESDRFMDEGRREKDDLQMQIDAADKQLKGTRQFLEEQANERELERDEFLKEIESLKLQMKEKDKEKTNYERFNKEDICENSCTDCAQLTEHIETLEAQLKETVNQRLEYEDKKQKLENDLKASVDKIFVLREIISELETQNESKLLNEHVLNEKVKELEGYIHSQNKTNESLHLEVESLRTEVDHHAYNEKITSLEEQLKMSNNSTEQNVVLEQLKDIDSTIDRKVKILETLYASTGSLSCSSPCEDVSAKHDSPLHKPTKAASLLCDEINKVVEKLKKHTVLEEATIKRLTDIEMQFVDLRNSYSELQHERDILQERMSEQLNKILSLQSRLDEQRLRAEDLYRQGTSDLSLKVHDLNNEISNLKEKLVSREKQINNLKIQLEQSKTIIDRQEAELASTTPEERKIIEKLELELQQRIEEINKLKDKIKNEMINKVTLPDLMETMLADKNDEIDQLRDKLTAKEHELDICMQVNLSEEEQRNHSKESGRTLSDIVSISEYDEPDMMRKMSQNMMENEVKGAVSEGLPLPPVMDKTSKLFGEFSFDHLKSGNKHSTTLFGRSDNENYFKDSILNRNKVSILSSVSPELIPRQINFSNLENSVEQLKNSKLERGTSMTHNQIIEENEEGLVPEMKAEIESLKLNLDKITSEKNQINLKLNERGNEVSKLQVELAAKNKLYADLLVEKKQLQGQLDDVKMNLLKLDNLEVNLKEKDTEMGKILDQIKKLESDLSTKNCDFETLKRNHSSILHENESLNSQLEKLKAENMNMNLKSAESFKNQINVLTQQIESLQKTISHKDELLTKLAADVENFKKNDTKDVLAGFQKELEQTKQELNEKMIEYEKIKIEKEMKESENENLRLMINRNDMNASPKLFSVDELAEQVEKELNYSAQLDSNILRAIESDDLNSEDEIPKKGDKVVGKIYKNQSEGIEWKAKFENEIENCKRLQLMIEAEKKKSNSIQIQDANIIEAIRHRLETALENENVLQKLLEEERMKTLHLAGIQKTKSFDNYLLMKSPGGDFSPTRKYHNRSQSDLESESVKRMDSEMKLMASQNERDKERIMDLQRVLERERNRFEKEIADRNAYGDDLKKEISRLIKEKENIELELDHSQERIMLAQQEIESLETRLALFQDKDITRSGWQERDRYDLTESLGEMRDLKRRCASLEKERSDLIENINTMRREVELNSRHNSQPTIKDFAGDEQVPEQFIIKLKEMNNLLALNTRENHRMAETLQLLTDERRVLQNRITELLENKQRSYHRPDDDLEERANHLFGKYLRVESHRKALVHQKRYLLIILAAYEKNEDKVYALLNGNDENGATKEKKKTSFKAAVLAVIAISRMKYIVHRWQSGRIVAARAIFSAPVNPRRSQSAFLPTFPSSPPVRDRTRRTLMSEIARPLENASLFGIRENLRYE